MTEQGHLLVAERVWMALGWPSHMHPAMCLGAIAPDAHRVTDHVAFRDLHFRSTRRAGYRLVDFLRQHLRPVLQMHGSGDLLDPRAGEPETVGFYVGWLTHICADDVWRQKIRTELAELWESVMEARRLERVSLRQEFHDEAAFIDIQIYQQNSQQIEGLRWLLEQAYVRSAVAPLQIADVHRWRQEVLEQHLPPVHFAGTVPRYLSTDFVLSAVGRAADEAVAMIESELKRVGQTAPA